ncbi:MAG: hypothetical protein RIK87_08025 [Fuerstiella sp.]
MDNMGKAVAELTANPSLLYQLKRALGDDHMSFQDALQASLELAIEIRGLKIALHNAILQPAGVVPSSAERFVSLTELHFAKIRGRK